MTWEQLALLAGALGLGSILRDLATRISARRSGRLELEQTAWQQRDREARGRRAWEEYGHTLRRWVHITCNVSYDEMPPRPDCHEK